MSIKSATPDTRSGGGWGGKGKEGVDRTSPCSKYLYGMLGLVCTVVATVLFVCANELVSTFHILTAQIEERCKIVHVLYMYMRKHILICARALSCCLAPLRTVADILVISYTRIIRPQCHIYAAYTAPLLYIRVLYGYNVITLLLDRCRALF